MHWYRAPQITRSFSCRVARDTARLSFLPQPLFVIYILLVCRSFIHWNFNLIASFRHMEEQRRNLWDVKAFVDENARTHILETFLYDNLERLRYWTLSSLICIVRIVALIIIIVIGYCIRELLQLSSILIVTRVASISSPTELQPRHNIVMGLLCGFCIVLCENVSWLEYFRRII